MKKYVVKRKDVCAGSLLKTIEVSVKAYDILDNEISIKQLSEQEITNISVFGGIICRGMLFNVNENGLANDLIYTTPTNYFIEGIQPRIDVKSEFVIQDYVELDELLKYLNYGSDLTQKDLKRIYNMLVTDDFWLGRHMELFGWEKDRIGGHSYCTGMTETVPMRIYHGLSSISCSKNGKPHKEEPGYSLIKKRR